MFKSVNLYFKSEEWITTLLGWSDICFIKRNQAKEQSLERRRREKEEKKSFKVTSKLTQSVFMSRCKSIFYFIVSVSVCPFQLKGISTTCCYLPFVFCCCWNKSVTYKKNNISETCDMSERKKSQTKLNCNCCNKGDTEG